MALNSWNSRDLPTPGSAITATICPCPACAIAAERRSASISRSRPTNFVNPRPAARCNRVRSGPKPGDLVHIDRPAKPFNFRWAEAA